MHKHKNLFIFLLISISYLLPLKAEQSSSTLYYLKGGACLTPGSSEVLPNFGVGMRKQNHHSGFDLSVNVGTLVDINYVSLKSLFLLYPHPLEKNQLYYGIGPSIGFGVFFLPSVGSLSRGIGAMEGMVGYEFRHSEHFKTFIQLELSQPILHFGKSRYFSYMPGVALMGGVGF